MPRARYRGRNDTVVKRMMEQANVETDAARRLLHDLNQPLTAIGNYAQAGCQLLAQGMNDPVRLRALFEKIVLQGNRASTLTHELGQTLAGATLPPQ
jgi:signal transduction histidine kinase